MNKKFLSRGKREDTKIWVEGYYFEHNGDYAIVDLNDRYNGVIPETVGRYTSLTDKNGKMIFEGDIIKYFDIEYQKYFIGVVYYCNAAFWIDSDDENDKDDGKNFVQIGNIPNEYIEVIGNIHDNPEMLSRANMPVSNDVFQPVFQPTTPENFELMHG